MYSRFEKLLKENKVSAYQVAKATHIGTATLSDWKAGKYTPKQDKLKKIAAYFGKPSTYFDPDADSSIFDYSNIFPVEKQKVPLLGQITCGEPILADEVFEGYVECNGKTHIDFCLRATGDSMIGARIYDGDIVFIHQQPSVENGEIAAVSIDNVVTLKRVYIDENSIELRAENPRFKPMRFAKNDFDQFRILGKAVAFQGDIV